VVANTLNGALWGGLHVFTLALSHVGCSIIPLSAEIPRPESLSWLLRLRPTALLGMPSWILSLAEHVAQSCADFQVDAVITGGEPMLPAMRERIRETLGVRRFLSTGYTSNETGAIGFQCAHLQGSSIFHLHESMQLVDLVDPLSAEPTEPGCQGAVVATNLNRTLMPTIAYRIGDLGRRAERPPTQNTCPCGRTLYTIELCGRCDNYFRLGGSDFYWSDIGSALEVVPNIMPFFTVHLRRSARGRDVLQVLVECVADSLRPSEAQWAETQAVFARELARTSSVAFGDNSETLELPELVLHAQNALPRNARTGKIPTMVDFR
jgi:phenylacetate-CoA ligase